MDQFQRDIAQMTEILKNAVEDSEARIINNIEVQADALENTLKTYIDDVMLPYMATIGKQTQSTPPERHNEQFLPADSEDMRQSSETSKNTIPNSTLHLGTTHLGTDMPSSVHQSNIPALDAPGTNNVISVHVNDVSPVHNDNRGLRNANVDSKLTPSPHGRLRAAANTQARHDVTW